MSTPHISAGFPALDPEHVELAKIELNQVLASQGFKRSERHSRFLRFVCESTLAGEAGQLNEYLIAHRVFGRGEDYSPGEDSVVRRQAFTLRQKLQDYYASDGRENPVRIELPVGRYVPTFKFHEPAVEAGPEEEEHGTGARAPEIAFPVFRSRKWPIAAVMVGLVAAIAGYAVGIRAQRTPVLDPALQQIWGPLLSPSEGSVICFSNAMTAGIRRTEQPFPETNLTRGIQLADAEGDRIRQQFRLPPGGFFYINPALAHAKMGEALGSVALAAMFTRAGVPVKATQSRYLNWQDFRSQNLVLLGHDEANQWLDPILSKLPLKQGRTTTDKPRRIVIPEPQPGERSEYYPDYSKGQNPPAEDYALISFLNGIDGRHGLALINGVNTEGTLMALEYLTDTGNLRDLENRLQKSDPRHSGPWHFQAILHSELRDGVPTAIELITFRPLP